MHSKAALEKRCSNRAAVSIPTRLLLPSTGPCKATAIDLSAWGMGLITSIAVPVGVRCAVAFEVATRQGRRRINAWGTAVHCAHRSDHRFHIGIRLVDMDPDSRLLLENGNAEALPDSVPQASEPALHAF